MSVELSMDPLTLSLVTLAIATGTTLFIYLFSTFFTRERTFEEALAEQKGRAEELGLGKKERPRVPKKQGGGTNKKGNVKKHKESVKVVSVPVVEEVQEEVVEVESVVAEVSKNHHHVAIVEEPEVIPIPTPSDPPPIKPVRRDSIKSILKNESAVIVVPEESVPPATNHFEILHPKDDLELKKETVVVEPPIKSKKKKEQPADLRSQLMKTVLSPEEVSGLIEILLNRQGGDGISKAMSPQWQQSKSESTNESNLARKLATLESSLKQETLNNDLLQSKLRELRAESTETKSKLTSTIRKLESELNNLSGIVSGLRREGQQLTHTLSTLRDEKINMQKSYQAEGGKRAEIESQLSASLQHNSHLESQLERAFNSNQDLSNQIHSLQLQYSSSGEKWALEENGLRTRFSLELSEREKYWAGKVGDLEARLKGLEGGVEDSQSSLLNAKNTIQNLNGEIELLKENLVHLTGSLSNKDDLIGRLEGDKVGLEDQVLLEKERGLSSSSNLQSNLSNLSDQLASLQLSNEELRNKNSKLMESLTKSEETLRVLVMEQQELKSTELVKSQNEETTIIQTLVSAGVIEATQSESWLQSILHNYEQVQAERKSSEEKLQGEVEHYQGVLKGTESLLTSLQQSLEAEEVSWRQKLENKDLELKEVEARNSTALTSLEETLSATQQRLAELEQEIVNGQNNSSNEISNNGSSNSPVSSPVSSSPVNSPVEKKKKKTLGGLFKSK